MPKGHEQYIVRFPKGMRDKIKAIAKANRRSMNAEIVFALDERVQAAAGEGFADTAPAADPIAPPCRAAQPSHR